MTPEQTPPHIQPAPTPSLPEAPPVSDTPPETPQGGRRLLYLGAGVAALVAVGVVLLVMRGAGPAGPRGGGDGAGGRHGGQGDLEEARSALVKATDLNTCRSALTQINSALHAGATPPAPSWAPGERDAVRQLLGLSDDEMGEIDGGDYSLLDAYHLDQCFLFRDAARALGVAPGDDAGPPPLERARAAFAWAVRQVRPRGADELAREARYLPLFGVPRFHTPPAFALRRGSGNELELALVFLELLRHAGEPGELTGCLVSVPAERGQRQLWACGVAVAGRWYRGGGGLYLFDPRLGLAVPGPGGRGVATLAQVRADPTLLKPLAAGGRLDFTAEQVKDARAHLVCPLSAVAPRLRHLEETLLLPAVRVRLAADVRGDAARLRRAAGPDTTVEAWQDSSGLLRRFLPTSEGGVDTATGPGRRWMFEFLLVPWEKLPPVFDDEEKFPRASLLGQLVLGRFARYFTDSVLGTQAQLAGEIAWPGGRDQGPRPRDSMLRGHFGKAAVGLVQELGTFHDRQQRAAREENLVENVDTWVKDEAHPAFLAYLEAVEAQKGGRGDPQKVLEASRRLSAVWNEATAPKILLDKAAAGPRLAEITWLLALCKHDQAEQAQDRLDAARRRGAPPDDADADAVAAAWGDAEFWWRSYLSDCPGAPGKPLARRQLARALAARGDRVGAVRVLEDTSEASPLEKAALTFEAERLKAMR
jgi:hypothetical protein